MSELHLSATSLSVLLGHFRGGAVEGTVIYSVDHFAEAKGLCDDCNQHQAPGFC